MAEIFSSFAQFKQYVGGAINQTVELDSLAPVIYDAARQHLVPWLGDAFYAEIVNEEHAELTPLVQRALALLTMYEYSKVGAIEFGEAGMFRIETDERKSAYKYQENNYREYMLEKGYEALEYLLKFLDTNKSSYSDWAQSDEGLMHLGPLLNYAADFRRLANVQVDRYTFETLRPIISDVEVFAVEKLLPALFWDDFKSRHIDGTLGDTHQQEKTLRKMMRTAIAQRALQEAVRLQWVTVKNGRVYLQTDTDSAANTRISPPEAASGVLLAHREIWADRYTTRWKEYIISNASVFSLAFDTESGGTNDDDDAWHINTEEEQAEADENQEFERNRPLFNL